MDFHAERDAQRARQNAPATGRDAGGKDDVFADTHLHVQGPLVPLLADAHGAHQIEPLFELLLDNTAEKVSHAERAALAHQPTHLALLCVSLLDRVFLAPLLVHDRRTHHRHHVGRRTRRRGAAGRQHETVADAVSELLWLPGSPPSPPRS
jgi:hypothetical protein